MLDAILGINGLCSFDANLVAKSLMVGNWIFTIQTLVEVPELVSGFNHSLPCVAKFGGFAFGFLNKLPREVVGVGF